MASGHPGARVLDALLRSIEAVSEDAGSHDAAETDSIKINGIIIKIDTSRGS